MLFILLFTPEAFEPGHKNSKFARKIFAQATPVALGPAGPCFWRKKAMLGQKWHYPEQYHSASGRNS